MKLLKKFRKKESGEDVATQAARELHAALSAPQTSAMPEALVPPMPASHEESNGSAGADEDIAAPIADSVPRPRRARAKGAPSMATTGRTAKPAPRAKAATAKKAGTTAARAAKQATTTRAVTKPAATTTRATATKKPRATSAKTSTARTTPAATTRKPAAKKG